MRLPSIELSQELRRYFLKSNTTSKTEGRGKPSSAVGHIWNASVVLCLSNAWSVNVRTASGPNIGGDSRTNTVAEQV